MDLRALRVVVAVAEQGSLTRAAASLHQSSSAVSHTLAGLEDELGVALFHRLPRGMAPTDAGKLFVAAARRVLHEAEMARATVDAIRGLVTGQVRVAAVLGFSIPLADLIGDFARRHPDVMVSVSHPATTDAVAERVRSGACDVGFIWAAPLPEDLDSVPVFIDPPVVVVPDGHPLTLRNPVRISDLRGDRMVAPEATSDVRPVVEALLRKHGVEPRVVAEAATNEMVLELVRSGVGYTISFASSAAMVAGRGAVALDIAEQPPITFLLVTRTQQDPTPAARAFRDLAVDRLGR